ncbi:MAG: LysE/ArgO family amino acid transporter [Desulfitobacteriaceae bacterium]
MLTAAIHGFLLAVPLIVPLGAQNVFVFNQGALQPKFIRTMPVVITAGLSDTLLISLAVMGVSVVVLSVFWLKSLLLTVGILFLLFMGWSTWRSVPNIGQGGAAPGEAGENEVNQAFSAKKQILFAASVSLLNPHAIMDTVGVIGTSSLKYEGLDKLAFALACILVSWFWFFTLAVAGRFMGTLDKTGHIMLIVNKVSAIVMWGAAVYIGMALF